MEFNIPETIIDYTILEEVIIDLMEKPWNSSQSTNEFLDKKLINCREKLTELRNNES